MKAVLAGLFMAAASNARPQQFEDLSLQPIKLDLGTPEGKSSDPTFGTADYVDPNPSYTYSYQVAADDTQTYIAHNENRKDGAVTGEYSYVDPYGTLITVTYIADDEGYREERSEQANFVSIRAGSVGQPAPTQAPVVQQVVQAVEPLVQSVVSDAGRGQDSDLVARIIAQLTPFIKDTVTSSLATQ